MNQLLLEYSYLQILDLLTTIAFLAHGVREGNPLVRFVISMTPGALSGLIVIKTVALGLGLYCWRLGKQRLLTRVNLVFAFLVAWNLVALIASAI